LPAPFGPIKQRSSPRRNRKLTSVTACTPPKALLKPVVCNNAGLPCAPLTSLREKDEF
jgi:hypothetical protein